MENGSSIADALAPDATDSSHSTSAETASQNQQQNQQQQNQPPLVHVPTITSTPKGAPTDSITQHTSNDDDEDEGEIDEATLLEQLEREGRSGNSNNGGKKSKGQKKKEKQLQKKKTTSATTTTVTSSSTTTTTTTPTTPAATTPTTSRSSSVGAGSSIPANIVIEYVMPDVNTLTDDPELLALYKHFMPSSSTTPSESSSEAEKEGGHVVNKKKSGISIGTDDEHSNNNDDDDDRSDNQHNDDDGEDGTDNEDEDDGILGASHLSNKQRKRLLSDLVSALKREVEHPEVVEAHDVRSVDPKLLVSLKGYRNTIQVPRHWCHKRKYLQGKRGIIKPPFELPDFITATGISKLRETDLDTQDAKTLKAKTRERAQPKMGRIEVDYQTLHDAFFIHQTKPKLSSFGDLYYEGKEFEKSHEHLKPGVLSDKLRLALGLPTSTSSGGGGDGTKTSVAAATSHTPPAPAPPPWLINMQRYGPPPSYPHLRIPGLNAPLPQGQRYGFGQGEWGRPPVDEWGNPLYGDVFGLRPESSALVDDLDGGTKGGGAGRRRRRHWGDVIDKLREDAEAEAEEKEEEKDASAVAASAAAKIAALEEDSLDQSIVATAGEGDTTAEYENGTASVAYSVSGSSTTIGGGGIETPASMELRKGGGGSTSEAPKTLYTVLEEKKTALTGGLLGTRTTYVLPTAGGGEGSGVGISGAAVGIPSSSSSSSTMGAGSGGGGGVALAIAPEDLGRLDEAEIAKRFEEEAKRAAVDARGGRENVSDLLEEQDKKRKRKLEDKKEGGKKSKQTFKF